MTSRVPSHQTYEQFHMDALCRTCRLCIYTELYVCLPKKIKQERTTTTVWSDQRH